MPGMGAFDCSRPTVELVPVPVSPSWMGRRPAGKQRCRWWILGPPGVPLRVW